MVTFVVESLDVSSSPPEWVNRSESSSEIAEEDVLLFLITLVDKGGMALIKGRVYGAKVGVDRKIQVRKTCVKIDL